MSKLIPVRGTRDIWGEDAERQAHVSATFEAVARRYGFDPISTPIFEFTEIFKRTLGETSDVVSKEMYTFEDRGGDQLTLRPEYTAGIARAFMSEGMKQFGTCKFFAHGPMFRYERPQKGRYRQFHQLDAEIIGEAGPGADLDIIALGYHTLEALGVTDKTVLNLNSLGDPESRANYRTALVDYFQGHKDKLSEDSRTRLDRNPLRILDSKDEGDRTLIKDAPRIGDYYTSEAADFFSSVKSGLTEMGITFEENPALVRGLDYYCHTAFEFITNDLGAQGTVIGGGRYDGLMEQLGGSPTPGVGWAGGIERLAMLLDAPPEIPRPIAIVPIGEEAASLARKLTFDLRGKGHVVECAYGGNVKKRLTRANKRNAAKALLIGDDELAQQAVMLRNLDSGEQELVRLDDLEQKLADQA